MGRGVSLVENRGNSELLIEFYLTNCGSSSIPLHRGWQYPCWGGIPLFTTHHPLPSTENEIVFLNKQLPMPMVSNVNTVFRHNSVFFMGNVVSWYTNLIEVHGKCPFTNRPTPSRPKSSLREFSTPLETVSRSQSRKTVRYVSVG